jgi:hypothetical protein
MEESGGESESAGLPGVVDGTQMLATGAACGVPISTSSRAIETFTGGFLACKII